MIYYGFAVLALCLSPLVIAVIGVLRGGVHQQRGTGFYVYSRGIRFWRR